ncbi:facilitated trehalose transporter Tret1-like isoform X1 [Drosophila nasuta]|uniref:facilitated trehalose transporter Tret1-like isoform X1 n=1 Tax=Drosophila nasuta TaxID=42062 RepID=UPI00295E71DB|nr:facilitated trehalose transporter Tret1-like isoform X1 [Drosophila nasuta]
MGCSSSTRNQFFAALSANLLTLSYGASFGWISSSYLQLQDPQTSLLTSGPFTKDDLGWVTSSLSPGGLFGVLFFGWLADKIGRKRCLLLMAVPIVLHWLLIATATNLIQLCVARFLAGAAGGCGLTVIPVYITELAEDRLRSTLGTISFLSFCSGLLLINVLGYLFHYVTVACIMIALPLVFATCFAFKPDTPQYLEQRNRREAEKSLKYYRGIPSKESLNEELQLELARLCKSTQQMHVDSDNNSFSWSDFTHSKARKAFFIGLGLVLTEQLNGSLIMLKYITVIFKDAGSSLSPMASALIVIAIQLLGTYSATLFVERAGRKTLLLISISGICLGEISTAGFYYLVSFGFNMSMLSWFPIAAYSLMVFSGSFGVLTVGFVVIAEITPPKIRSRIIRVHMFIDFALDMSIAKVFPLMSDSMGIPAIVAMFAVFCFLFLVFMVVFVPETKGKSIEAIQENL